MNLKFNILGKEVEVNLGKPKAAKADEKFILEKLGDVNQGKGETSLSPHFHYFFPNSEICKVEGIIRGEERKYPGLNVILLDPDTNQPIKYGTVSIRTFTTPKYNYKNKETLERELVNIFPEIENFSKSSKGIKDFIEDNFVGKVFSASGEVQIIDPQFVDGRARYIDEFGNALPTRSVPTYKEVEPEA